MLTYATVCLCYQYNTTMYLIDTKVMTHDLV